MKIKDKVLEVIAKMEEKCMLSILEKPEEEIIDLTLAEVGKVIDEIVKRIGGDVSEQRLVGMDILQRELKQKLGIK